MPDQDLPDIVMDVRMSVDRILYGKAVRSHIDDVLDLPEKRCRRGIVHGGRHDRSGLRCRCSRHDAVDRACRSRLDRLREEVFKFLRCHLAVHFVIQLEVLIVVIDFVITFRQRFRRHDHPRKPYHGKGGNQKRNHKQKCQKLPVAGSSTCFFSRHIVFSL